MRKIVLSLLLASAAASPALAQDQGDGWRHNRPANNQQQDNRQQVREQRQQVREAVQAVQPQQAAPQFDRRPAIQQGQRGGFDRVQFERGRQQQVQAQQQQQVQMQQQRAYGYRGYNGGYAGRQSQQVQQAERTNGWTRDGGDWNRQGGDDRQRQVVQQQIVRQQYAQQGDRSRWSGNSWNRDWRNDRRYDWRDYRDRHRSVFRLGVYFDPFGYGYRPFNIGYQLRPAYFGQRYWIDPAMYELPYPPPGTQWVRYWNDALLVDIYSGQVVDVIHDFFW